MSLPLKLKIRSGYLFAFLLLLVSYFLIFHIIRQLVTQSQSVSHSYEVINTLERIKSEITDAETGVRGYIITKDNSFLSPYYTGSRNVQQLVRDLKSITSDNKEFSNPIDSLEVLVDKRINFLAFTLSAYQMNGMVLPDSFLTNRQQISRTMDSIRSYIRDLQNREVDIMAQRNAKLDGFFSSTYVIAITSLLIAIFTIIYSLWVYNRENKAKEKSNAQVRAYSQELEERVTELNKVNIELQELKSIEKFASTGRIARTMAHEVRNPLTNISLASEQLKEIVVDNDEAELLLGMIGRNVNRINQLVSDLLQSTRFAQLDYSSINVNELLDETLLLAKDRIDLNGVRVEKYYSGELCHIHADREKIKLAFLNIIVNAIESMEKTSGVLQLRTRKQGDRCLIEFRDNGTGMDDETIQKLFEPYFTSKLKGNGLGLTNTQNIILNHKGTISVNSKPGNGSSFTISLSMSEE